MKKILITIDGPAASGKEKISKHISRKWKLKHLDSGILYRRLALIFLNDNVDFTLLTLENYFLRYNKQLFTIGEVSLKKHSQFI